MLCSNVDVLLQWKQRLNYTPDTDNEHVHKPVLDNGKKQYYDVAMRFYLRYLQPQQPQAF